MAVEVPHDPRQEGGTCPICHVTWPCPERLRQRKEAKGIRSQLRAALFEPTKDVLVTIASQTVRARRWEDKLGWFFDLGYGEVGLVAQYNGGNSLVQSVDATEEWAEQALL
jgi:hypothetical protein